MAIGKKAIRQQNNTACQQQNATRNNMNAMQTGKHIEDGAEHRIRNVKRSPVVLKQLKNTEHPAQTKGHQKEKQSTVLLNSMEGMMSYGQTEARTNE
jgi:hypothetical protein